MFNPLDGPATQFSLSVSDSVVVEVKGSTSTLPDRAVVTLLPLDGMIWVYFGDDTASPPSAADVKAKGFPHYRRTRDSYEAGPHQPLYIVSDSGTVNVRCAERA